MAGYVGTADTGIKPPVCIFEAARIGSGRFMMDEDAKYPRLSERRSRHCTYWDLSTLYLDCCMQAAKPQYLITYSLKCQ